MIFKAAASDGEGFDQAGNVLLRTNGAGVEQKRITDLIAFEDAVTLARGVMRPGSGGVVGGRWGRNRGSGAL